jgi:hypothetical protein
MPTAMVESNVLDSNEWPTLGGPTSRTRTAPGSAAPDTGSQSIPRAGMMEDEQGEEGQHDDGDWENLQPLSPPPSNQRPRSVSVVSNVAMVERTRPLLRHCASSPDLRHLHNLDEEEDDDNDEDEYDVINNNDAETLSFAVLSGPGSVMSMASGFSFRDAILSPGGVGTIREEPLPSSPSGSSGGTRKAVPKTEPRKPRAQPRFVVKPIRRCSKSMGDLRSLAEGPENEDGGAEEVMGATDAMDFYHRKALGAKGRTNGLKIRPDELKRKQFTLQRKEMQRQAQR